VWSRSDLRPDHLEHFADRCVVTAVARAQHRLGRLQVGKAVLEELAADVYAHDLAEGDPVASRPAVQASEAQYLQQLALQRRRRFADMRNLDVAEGAAVRPTSSNSFTPAAADAELRFMASASGRLERLQVNSRVCSMLRMVALQPSLEKPMIFGVAENAPKKL